MGVTIEEVLEALFDYAARSPASTENDACAELVRAHGGDKRRALAAVKALGRTFNKLGYGPDPLASPAWATVRDRVVAVGPNVAVAMRRAFKQTYAADRGARVYLAGLSLVDAETVRDTMVAKRANVRALRDEKYPDGRPASDPGLSTWDALEDLDRDLSGRIRLANAAAESLHQQTLSG